MSFADWEPVVIDKRGRRAPGESKEEALSRAMRAGTAVAEKRIDHTAGTAGVSIKKLDEDTDHFARK